jgi:hypothetical protein
VVGVEPLECREALLQRPALLEDGLAALLVVPEPGTLDLVV